MKKRLDIHAREILYLDIFQTTASKLANHFMLFSLLTSFSRRTDRKYKTRVIKINLNSKDLKLNYNSIPRQWTV